MSIHNTFSWRNQILFEKKKLLICRFVLSVGLCMCGEVFLMNAHNVCFDGEIRKILILFI